MKLNAFLLLIYLIIFDNSDSAFSRKHNMPTRGHRCNYFVTKNYANKVFFRILCPFVQVTLQISEWWLRYDGISRYICVSISRYFDWRYIIVR